MRVRQGYTTAALLASGQGKETHPPPLATAARLERRGNAGWEGGGRAAPSGSACVLSPPYLSLTADQPPAQPPCPVLFQLLQIVDQFLAQLDSIFGGSGCSSSGSGSSPTPASSSLASSRVVDWAREPWVQGAYTWVLGTGAAPAPAPSSSAPPILLALCVSPCAPFLAARPGVVTTAQTRPMLCCVDTWPSAQTPPPCLSP